MPNLKEFELYTESSEITFQSIIHLGNYCRWLRRLCLCADIDFIELAHVAPRPLLPVLRELSISPLGDGKPLDLQKHEDVLELALRISEVLPRCSEFFSGYSIGHDLGDKWDLDKQVHRFTCPSSGGRKYCLTCKTMD